MSEIWKSVVGWETFYEVSNMGRVRNLSRPGQRGRAAINHRIKTLQVSKAGYLVVDLSAGGRASRKVVKVHVLVLEAFVGPRPTGYHGCHNDGNRANAQLSNLRWASPVENSLDRYRHGTMLYGSSVKRAKLDDPTVLKIRKILKERRLSHREVGEMFGASAGTISDIHRNKTWRHLDA